MATERSVQGIPRGDAWVRYQPSAISEVSRPDFVAETEHFVLMVETKARNELEVANLVAKAEAGAVSCKHASEDAGSVGSKPWNYLLVPHAQVTEDKTEGLLEFREVNAQITKLEQCLSAATNQWGSSL